MLERTNLSAFLCTLSGKFYGKTLGLELSAGPEGTLVLSGAKTLIFKIAHDISDCSPQRIFHLTNDWHSLNFPSQYVGFR